MSVMGQDANLTPSVGDGARTTAMIGTAPHLLNFTRKDKGSDKECREGEIRG
jgi:hypothetical protein